MRIPLEWLNEYVDISKKDPKEIAETFTKLGLMQEKPVENGVLELEHRMDRSDWLSIIGCARDYAAFEDLKLNYPKIHTEKGKVPTKEQKIKIEVECPEVVNRFNTRTFRGISIKESPKWLKERLEAYGVPPINNIVDITNYVMIELGQPMHAQDLAKMKAQEIVIRCAKPGEKVKTILGEDVELSKGQFVLTQAGEPTVIGGIVGGISTAVDGSTNDIILDAGNYNQVNVRRSSRKLKIQNETVQRYDKFLQPEACQLAIERATALILELAGGEYYENEDWYPNRSPLTKMVLRYDRVKKIGGVEISKERIKEILLALEYKILLEDMDKLELEVPFFRTDVLVEDDVVADVYRIHDYNKIPVEKISSAPPEEITPKIYKFENKLKDIMVSFGLHEHITNPLVKIDSNIKGQITLKNALNSEKSALRTEISQTLCTVAQLYQKHRLQIVGIFEVGLTYHENNGKYEENKVLEAIIVAENSQIDRVKQVKSIIAALLQNIGVLEYKYSENNIVIQDKIVGEINNTGFKIFTKDLLEFDDLPKRVISEFENHTKENFSFIMEKKQELGEVHEIIKKQSDKIVNVEILETRMRDKEKSVLFEVTYSISETQEIRESILKSLKKIGVDLRN